MRRYSPRSRAESAAGRQFNQTGRTPVGELRPSQMLYTYGVGAVVDLPKIAAMVMGLDDWDVNYCAPVEERRLLAAVKAAVGQQVESLRMPPYMQESNIPGVIDSSVNIGVPVAAFPRTMVCPRCRLVSSVGSGLFELRPNLYRPEKTCYVHASCHKANRPEVLPVRFVMACKNGHLDDFPWRWFCHKGPTDCNGALRLNDAGIAGEATDLLLVCDACEAKRRMSDAFGEDAKDNPPNCCTGRRPHLRDRVKTPCQENARCILVGASNAWFPLSLSTLYLPVAQDALGQLVEQHWATLESIADVGILSAYRRLPAIASTMAAFGPYTDAQLLSAINAKRSSHSDDPPPVSGDIKAPEWSMLSQSRPENNGDDFWLTPVTPPVGYESVIEKVVLAERLREVKALIGFTRIKSPGEFSESEDIPPEKRVALSRNPPSWVPASEVRGEGIFIQFKRSAIEEWASRDSVRRRSLAFHRGHENWRTSRGLPPDNNCPAIGYVLLHSFSHALMRQLVLECGYTAASIRERLYWSDTGPSSEQMAGVLLYTAAPDSEGTLGGLVSLGRPKILGRHISQALEMIGLCASDPLCAEHDPSEPGNALHGATCHACLFSPETSCERNNKYLDRSVLVQTLEHVDLSFFGVNA